MKKNGYIHIYTGEGKGKTTAAVGLIFRAAAAGMKVFLAQFIKRGDYGEVKALKYFDDLVTVEQFGLGRFLGGKCSPADVEAARRGYEKMKGVLASGDYDVVVLDEANVAVAYNLFSVRELLNLIDLKPPSVELIITGRHAAPEVMERADLVTEMKAVKHYFQAGVKARVGIEK